jgi:TatD DNase family protein
MFKYFDAHSHLNLPEFDVDREEQIKKLEKLNIGTITIGVDKATSGMAVELAQKSDNLYAGIGLHPTDSDEDFDNIYFEDLIKNLKVVCVGECGLDYFRLGKTPGVKDAPTPGVKESFKVKQKEIFIKQIDLALKYEKPLMLHCRPSKGTMDAYEDVLDLLEARSQELGAGVLRGNAHFFVGDIKIAERFMSLGFTMSFPGVITFARDYDEVIKFLPLTSILPETDAPFAAPVPYRGQRNEPSYIIDVVKKIAEIKGEDYEYVRQVILKNIQNLFKI